MATMDMDKRKIRVLLTKSDQDAHDRGVRYIAEVLRDAGMEVIFIRYRICDEVSKIALEEDVDVIGMSFYSSGYIFDVPAVLDALNARGKKVKLIIGGIIPSDEAPRLMEIGVAGIFGPDTPTEEVIACISS
jgi:methylmalonyl-CoA mutase C-terminal domain/subunit